MEKIEERSYRPAVESAAETEAFLPRSGSGPHSPTLPPQPPRPPHQPTSPNPQKNRRITVGPQARISRIRKPQEVEADKTVFALRSGFIVAYLDTQHSRFMLGWQPSHGSSFQSSLSDRLVLVPTILMDCTILNQSSTMRKYTLDASGSIVLPGSSMPTLEW